MKRPRLKAAIPITLEFINRNYDFYVRRSKNELNAWLAFLFSLRNVDNYSECHNPSKTFHRARMHS